MVWTPCFHLFIYLFNFDFFEVLGSFGRGGDFGFLARFSLFALSLFPLQSHKNLLTCGLRYIPQLP